MPKIDGVFVPDTHCTWAGGDCFYEGRCLGGCRRVRKKDHENRIKTLELAVAELQKKLSANNQTEN